MNRRSWLLAFTLMAPAAARAAGFELPDNGTQALGRGTAFTAIANDGTALEYNPGGLVQENGLQLTLDVNRLDQQITYQRADSSAPSNAQAVNSIKNSNSPFVAPDIALQYAHDLPIGRLAVAVGVYGPSSVGQLTFPTPNLTNATEPAQFAPQRYQLITNNEFIAYPTLALAYKLPLPFYAAIGVAGQVVYSHLQFEQDIYAQPSQQTAFGSTGAAGSQGLPESQQNVAAGSYRATCLRTASTCNRQYSQNAPTSIINEDPGWDAQVNVDVTGKLSYTAVIGGLVKLGWVSLGASIRPGYHIHADGTMNIKLPAVLTDPNASIPIQAQVQGNKAALDLDWPTTIRLGIDVAIPVVPGDLDVSVDYVHENWAVTKNFTLTPENIEITSAQTKPQALAPVEIPKDMQSTNSIRAGVGYELPIPVVKLQVRAGGYWEQSAIPDAYTSVDLAHFGGIAMTAGASVGINVGNIIGPLMLDLGGLYAPNVTRTVTDSAIPLTTSDPYLAKESIGNGTYSSQLVILSAGIRGHFSL